ncbi:MAG: hypothetical protein GY854_07950 [Deltaproteobacteria bacterium]|nr:hypothetical protein [Deltaproteobacteria bacterium]
MRAKIILPNFIAVLVLGLGGFFYLRQDLTSKSTERLKERIETTSVLYGRSEGLHGFELLNNVRTQAMSKNMVDAFAPIKPEEGESAESHEKRVRGDWFKKCVQSIALYTEQWSEKTGKRPELVFLTDRNGVVIARNTTPNACPAHRKVADAMPVISRALDGEATYMVWSIDDSPFSSTKQNSEYCQLMNTGLLELAAAPVWFEDDIAGALVIGFEISNGTAKKNAEMVNLDLAVLTGGDVYSTSFATDTARQSLEQQLKRSDVAEKLKTVVSKGAPSNVFEILVEDKPYLALASPVVSAEKKDNVVTLIIGSVEDAASDLGSLIVLIFIMVAALLIVFIAGMLLTNHFLGPVMAIEEGLLKVINGAFNYRFDVKSSEVGGLSYRINQLIGVLTGEEEEEDEE